MPTADALRQLENGLAQVRRHRDAGEIDKAVTLVAALVRSEPTHVPALRLMASLAMQTGTPTIAVGCLARATAVSPRAVELWVDYGEALLAGGKPADAEAAFRKALALRGNDGTAFRGLAQAQLDQNKTEDALKSFRKALSILPYDSYAAHMAAALSGEGSTLSSRYVPELFDKYASTFDEHLTGTLGYGVPAAIRDAVAPRAATRPMGTMLDLGCGTGLVAAALTDLVPVRDGIDISREMVGKARDRGIYRHLAAADIVPTLTSDETFAGPYDLVTAGDVFIYVGPLDAVFVAVRRVLAAGGLFAFSVEQSLGADVAVRSSGRYAHAASYIERLSEQHGFTPLQQTAIDIRQERNQPIRGDLFLLARA